MTQEIEKLKKQKAEIEARIEALESKYPKCGEKVYCLDRLGFIEETTYTPRYDKRLVDNGYASKDKAFLERRRDRDALRRELVEATNGWKPDWGNKKQGKFFICYSYVTRNFAWECLYALEYPGVTYFKKPDQGLIERFGDRLHLLMDGEA